MAKATLLVYSVIIASLCLSVFIFTEPLMSSSVHIYDTVLCCDDVTTMGMRWSDIIAVWPIKQPNSRNMEGRLGEDENTRDS